MLLFDKAVIVVVVAFVAVVAIVVAVEVVVVAVDGETSLQKSVMKAFLSNWQIAYCTKLQRVQVGL